MKVKIFTLFPEFFESYQHFGIIKRALDQGLIEFDTVQIRDFSTDKHHRVDDYPFSGSSGMLMTPQPLFDALEGEKEVIYLSPRGKVLTQEKARELSQKKELTLLCGHYEGIDQRVIDTFVTEEISIGDYILSGGEIAALVLMDTVFRLIPGVIRSESTQSESHERYLLEYNQYTRPRVFRGLEVPEVLFNGNHEEIRKYLLDESIRITLRERPDLIEEGLKNNAYSKEILERMKTIREEDSHEPKHHS
ncbi:tRNA (guanosine(37)-N1)-methyltransferase TrmD [Guggenheimella bovis]